MKKVFKNLIVYIVLFSMLAVFITGCDPDPIGEGGIEHQKPGELINTYTPSNPAFKLQKDEYSFENSGTSFGYGTNYKIPIKRYEQAFNVLENDIPKDITDKLQDMSSIWVGSCLGMAVTAKLFNIGFIEYSKVTKDAACTHDFKSPGSPGAQSSRLTELIEQYQIYQEYGQEVIREYNESPTEPTKVLRRAMDGARNGQPVVIEVRGDMGGACGHALLPYRFDELTGGIYNVYVYDCNEPDNENRILTINTANNTWKYQLFSDKDIFWGSEKNHSMIYCRRISAFMEKPTPAWTNTGTNTYLYVSNASSVTIKSSKGNAEYKDGELITNIEGACLIPVSAVSKDKRSGCSTSRFLLPLDKYDVTINDDNKALKKYDIIFMGNNKIILLKGINNLTPVTINPLKASIYIKPDFRQDLDITIYNKKINTKSISYSLKGQVMKNSDIDISFNEDDSIKVISPKSNKIDVGVSLPGKRIIRGN